MAIPPCAYRKYSTDPRVVRLERIWTAAQRNFRARDFRRARKALLILARWDADQGKLAENYLKSLDALEAVRGIKTKTSPTDPAKLDEVGDWSWRAWDEPLEQLIEQEDARRSEEAL